MPPKRKASTRTIAEESGSTSDIGTAVVSDNESKIDEKNEPKTKKMSKKHKPCSISKSPQPGSSSRITTENSKVEKQKTDRTKKTVPNENLQNEDIKKEHGPSKAEKPTMKKLQNKTETEWDTVDFSCHETNDFSVEHSLIVSTWNVGGIKSWVKKGCMEYLKYEHPNILCIQETKCAEEKIPEELKQLEDYHQYWCSSGKEGYAGVGLLSMKEPKSVTYGINDKEQDVDGRCITAEYDNFYLVNVYVPNSGRKLVSMPKRLKWNKAFKEYLNELKQKKPVIICGDMNVSHTAIDLARPQNNTKNAGFTVEEREGQTELLNDGFVDVYRHLYPQQKDVYSFWTYMANARANNVGWSDPRWWTGLRRQWNKGGLGGCTFLSLLLMILYFGKRRIFKIKEGSQSEKY